jgi:hypothetical protein
MKIKISIAFLFEVFAPHFYFVRIPKVQGLVSGFCLTPNE